MKSIACLFFLFMAFATSHGEAENDQCFLISVVTESKQFDVTWKSNKESMKIINKFKQEHDNGDESHMDLGQFGMMKHGGNWTFKVELYSAFRIDATVSVEFPPEVTVTPNTMWVEAKSIDPRYNTWHTFEMFHIDEDRRHWVGDIHARMNLTELATRSDPFNMSLVVDVDFAKVTYKDTTRPLCQDPKSVMKLVQSGKMTDKPTVESFHALSRVAVVWKIKEAGKLYQHASTANSVINLGHVILVSEEAFGGERVFSAHLWNFGAFKTIEIVAYDMNYETGIDQSKMAATIVAGGKEHRLTDMSRYLMQSKRAELYVNETELVAMKDSFDVIFTFDPTPGQYSV